MAVSIDQLRKAAVESGILTAVAFATARALLPDEDDSASAEPLVKLLVKQSKLTKFQAQLLYQGKGASLKLGNYLLIQKLGEGGMGQVFLAEHQRMKRRVALKVLPAHLVKDKQAIERFHREAQAAARLTHPNVVTAFDADEARGMHFLVMEFVPGTDLAVAVKQTGPLSVGKAVDCLLQAAEGLKYAHEHGVIHRDIKPANLLLSTEGVVKVLDMGLARLDDGPASSNAGLTGTDIVMGTVDYMSPEQAASTKSADARSDVYSLGCTLHFLLTGQPVYIGESLVQRILAHREQPIPSLRTQRPDVPAVLDDLFAKMIAKRPEERMATMSEVVKNLKSIVDGSAILQPQDGDAGFASDTELQRFLHATFSPTILTGPEQAAGVAVPTKIAEKPSQAQQDTVPSGFLLNTQTVSPAGKPGQKASPKGSPGDTNRWPPRKKILAAAAAGAMSLLLGIIIITIRNKDGKETIVKVPDGSTTDIELPEGGIVNIRHEPDGKPNPASGGRQPSDTPSEMSNSKSQIPADPDRAAAEWVLSQQGHVLVEIITIADGKRHTARTLADLSVEPFQVHRVQLVESPDVDAAAIAQQLGSLESLQGVCLQHSQGVADDVLLAFSQMPKLTHVSLESTGVSAQGIIALVKSRPIQSLGIDSRQFSVELVPLLEQMPSLHGFSVVDATDKQLRQMFCLKQLTETNIVSGIEKNSDLRHSTCARLAVELANLRSISIDNVRFDDADLAAITRMPNLRDLLLTRLPAVTDSGLTQLASNAQIQVLLVTNCGVTSLGLADFLESQPACQVVWDRADHRAVAEWVLSVGGKVQLAGRGAEWISAADQSSRHSLSDEAPQPPVTDQRPAATSGDAAESQSHHSESDVYFNANPVFLTGVDLSGLATLQDADLARLADCTTLRDLQLYNTSLTGACLAHIQRLTRLKGLNVAYLPIEDQHLASLSELKQLQYLRLGVTKVTDAGMPALAGLTELVGITLQDTPISSVGLESLKRLPNLASLDLTNTAAESRAVEVLCEFPRLSDVHLSNTRVTEADVKRLVQRPLPWHRLYLSNLPTVTDAILTDLRGQRELITLELVGTSVTAAAFETFVREHPRLGMTLPTDESTAPDLRVARRIISAGGSVHVQIAAPQPAAPLSARTDFNLARAVQGIEELPKEPFRIVYLQLAPAGAEVTDETLAEVGRLEMLRNFSTAGANLTDRMLLEIVAAPQLEWLYLDGSMLSPDTVRQLATRTRLTGLHLQNTGLDGPAAASIAALTKLQSLDVGASTLTDDNISFVEKLTALEFVAIGSTKIVNHGWASIAKLPKLKHLSAYNMPVTDGALRYAGQIETLEFLSVGGDASEVGDAGLQHLRSFRHLRELGLNHCRRITDAGLESLTELPSLETLYLNATPITDAGLQHLAKIKTLKSLNLAECQLSEAAIDDLQDALPWCRITK